MKKLLKYIFFFLFNFSAISQTYYLVNSGNWGDSNNWSLENCSADGNIDGSVPDDNDTVIICSEKYVILDDDITVSKVIILDNGSVTDNGDNKKFTIENTLKVYGTGRINMMGDEDFKVEGEANFLGNGTMNISGKSIFEDNFILSTQTIYNQNGNQDFKLKGIENTINGVINILGNKKIKLEGNTTQYLYGTGTITSTDEASFVEIKNSNKIIAASANLTIQPMIKFKKDNFYIINHGIITLQYNGVKTQGDLDSESKNNYWLNAENSILNYGGLTDMFDTKGDLYASSTNNIVNYNGPGNQNIFSPNGNTYYHLYTESSGTKTIQNILDINGNVNISGTSIFDSADNDLTVAGNWNNKSIFIPGNTKVTLDGINDQYINFSSLQAETFTDLAINKLSGNVYMTENSDVIITNQLDLIKGLIYINSSNLIINENATVINFSDASFVNTNSTGYLRKLWSSPGLFIYPVGSGTELTQFSLQIFNASFGTGAYAEINVSGNKYFETGITENFIDRFWDLPVSGITSPIYNFTAYYLDGDVNGEESDIKAQKFDTEWEEFNLANTFNNTLSGTGFTSFGKFGGFDELITLPVELTRFEAEQIDDFIYLTWETAAEINNDYFIVEKSSDGIIWESIKTIPGAGNSIIPITYSINDPNGCNGNCYYRLKQIDFDGSQTTYKAVLLQGKTQNTKLEVNVYPNPTSDFIDISLLIQENESYTITLTNKLAEIVYQRERNLVKGLNYIRISLTDYCKGSYYLQVYSNSQLLATNSVIKL